MNITNPRTGINIHLEEQGSGDQPLLFIHGWTGNHTRWARTLTLLPHRHTIACDLRGHGRSDKSPDLDYSFPAHVEDLIGILDALRIPSAVLVGHSMGGMIAQHAALAYPERVSALVLVATAACITPEWSRFLGAHAASWLFRNFFHPAMDYKDRYKKLYPRDYYPDLYDPLLRTTPEAASACLHAIAHHDVRWILRDLRTPTLILASEDDPTVPPRYTRELARLIPNARLIFTSGSDHHIAIEQPDFIAGHINTFLTPASHALAG